MADMEDMCRGGFRRPGPAQCRLCPSPCAASAAAAPAPAPAPAPAAAPKARQVDVVVVGAGVIGCSIARELSKYTLSVVVLEKANDVAQGASKANSGIVHGGYDARHGTLKGKLAHRGNRMFAQLDRELNFGVRNTGSLTVGFSDEDRQTLEGLAENGRKNGVEGLVLLTGEQVLALEPRLNPKVTCALLCRHTSITSPYEYTIALAENAVDNGVEVRLSEEVTGIDRREGGDAGFVVHTAQAEYRARVVVNCAGLGSARVAAMVGANNFQIEPHKGEYLLLNKSEGRLLQHVIFQCPHPVRGKGVLVSQTYHGNLLVGPTSRGPKDAAMTNQEVLRQIVTVARRSLPTLDPTRAITSYTGLRAKAASRDFIVEESERVPGFINCAGIDSPGLTSSPAVAKMVVGDILRGASKRLGLQFRRNARFNPFRRPILLPKPPDFPGRIGHEDPHHNIVCRCERVTEAEIVESIHRGIPAHSTDGVKKRTRAGMGPCQGSFCEPRVAKIIARELGVPVEQVPRRGSGSSLLSQRRVGDQDRAMLSKL